MIRITADPAWGWAGGLRHPPVAEYPAGMLTPAQMTEMRLDAALTVEVIEDARGETAGDLPVVVGGTAPAPAVAGASPATVTVGTPAPALADGGSSTSDTAAVPAGSTDAPTEGAPASNPAPDGGSPPGETGPEAAASKPAASAAKRRSKAS